MSCGAEVLVMVMMGSVVTVAVVMILKEIRKVLAAMQNCDNSGDCGLRRKVMAMQVVAVVMQQVMIGGESL